VSKNLYEYIRIFIRVIFFDTNIFGHSFVSKFSRMSHSDSYFPRYAQTATILRKVILNEICTNSYDFEKSDS